MNSIRKAVLKAVAGAGRQAAIKAAGAASAAFMHQPKEPAALRNLKK